MNNGSLKKKIQLEMPIGTASSRLKKSIMFSLIKSIGLDSCFQCGDKILSEDQMSIEHKIPWLDSEDPRGLFFDLDNIAYSHLSCNIGSARKIKSLHGTKNKYRQGCRCEKCRDFIRKDTAEYRKNRKIKTGSDR